MRIGKLFIGKRETNETGRFVLASWTATNYGYWRWVISYRTVNGMRGTFKWPLCGPSFNSGKIYSPGKGHFGMWAVIPFLGYFSITTQPALTTPNKGDLDSNK